MGDRGQIRTPPPVKEFFRPNPDHVWFATWEDTLLIFQRKGPLFFHHVYRNVVHHPRTIAWYNSRVTFEGLPARVHDTVFDWVDKFDVEVYDGEAKSTV